MDIRLPYPSLGIRTYKGVTKPNLFCPFKCVSSSCLILCVKLLDLQTFENGPCHAMIPLMHLKLQYMVDMVVVHCLSHFILFDIRYKTIHYNTLI